MISTPLRRLPISIGIRPEDVEIRDAPFDGAWAVQVVVSEPLGAQTLLTLQAGGCLARALTPAREWPSRLWMRWPLRKLHWFDGLTGMRLEGSPSGGPFGGSEGAHG